MKGAIVMDDKLARAAGQDAACAIQAMNDR